MRLKDDSPITLEEACKLYPGSCYKVSTLKAAADKGLLTIFRLGRRYHTTPLAMDEWVEKCQDAARRRASITTRKEIPGSSVTARDSSAQAALKEKLRELRRN